MGKYTIIDEPVFITSIEERKSYHGGTVYTITFKSINTQKDYKTYADPGNMNFRNWKQIITTFNGKGVVLDAGLKLKDDEKSIINADSVPEITYVVTKEELAKNIDEYWQSQSQFGKLFTNPKVPAE